MKLWQLGLTPPYVSVSFLKVRSPTNDVLAYGYENEQYNAHLE